MVAMELQEKTVCIIVSDVRCSLPPARLMSYVTCPQTGGASGIGKETAKLFAKNGHRVVIADRSVQLGEELVKELEAAGGEAAFVQLDIADEESVKASIAFALDKYGRIDTSVNCAGIGGPSAYVQSQWDLTWA
jgi:NAD(P)-dependent dehydrogenase (short-subunit alcohol dehydrogenase family)